MIMRLKKSWILKEEGWEVVTLKFEIASQLETLFSLSFCLDLGFLIFFVFDER